MALVQYIVPTINFLLGWLAYDERLDAWRVAGFVVVWIAVGTVMADALRRREAAPRAAALAGRRAAVQR
jgi:chloramphenicol-sensitive protein RarD